MIFVNKDWSSNHSQSPSEPSDFDTSVLTAVRELSLQPDDSVPRNYVSMLCVGDLTVRTAAADIFECVVSAAEAAPWQEIRIGWIGDGDLRGVLQAQPLPASLKQHFHGSMPDAEIAHFIAGADLLCLLGRTPLPPDLTAMARQAGVPVIGSVSSLDIEPQSQADGTCWSFKYRDLVSMAAALDSALHGCPRWVARPNAAASERLGIEE